jgi:hypothetical protein
MCVKSKEKKMSPVYCENCGAENINASRACLCSYKNFSSQPISRMRVSDLHYRADEVIQALRRSPNVSYLRLGVMLSVPSGEVAIIARQAGLS